MGALRPTGLPRDPVSGLLRGSPTTYSRCRQHATTGAPARSSPQGRAKPGRRPGVRPLVGSLRAALLRPGNALAYFHMNSDVDVRAILPTIRVPTLVLQRREDVYRYRGTPAPRVAHSRREGGAPPGRDHLHVSGTPTLLIDEIEEFLTGSRARAASRIACSRRSSSPTSSAPPSAPPARRPRWRDLVDSHDALVRRELARFRGARGRHRGRRLPRHVRRPGARDPLRRRPSSPPSGGLGLEVRAGVHTGEVELMRRRRRRASPSTSARGSPRMPDRARSSCRPPFVISSPARGSRSWNAACFR